MVIGIVERQRGSVTGLSTILLPQTGNSNSVWTGNSNAAVETGAWDKRSQCICARFLTCFTFPVLRWFLMQESKTEKLHQHDAYNTYKNMLQCTMYILQCSINTLSNPRSQAVKASNCPKVPHKCWQSSWSQGHKCSARSSLGSKLSSSKVDIAPFFRPCHCSLPKTDAFIMTVHWLWLG